MGALISPTFQNNLDGAADESISADILAGTFYILLTAQESGANAYRLEITVGEPTVELPPQDSTVLQSLENNTTPETPATRTTDLGDMTESGKTFYQDRVNGAGTATAKYTFTLSNPKMIALVLRHQDVDADVYIDDGDGKPLYGSYNHGTADEEILADLPDGSYTVRIEAQKRGRNDYTLRLNFLITDPAEVPNPRRSGPLRAGHQPRRRPGPRHRPGRPHQPDQGGVNHRPGERRQRRRRLLPVHPQVRQRRDPQAYGPGRQRQPVPGERRQQRHHPQHGRVKRRRYHQ